MYRSPRLTQAPGARTLRIRCAALAQLAMRPDGCLAVAGAATLASLLTAAARIGGSPAIRVCAARWAWHDAGLQWPMTRTQDDP
jgi:hypothetical protein